MLNILGNSLKFTNVGSISIFVEKDIDKSNLKIRVEDTGIGIPANMINGL